MVQRLESPIIGLKNFNNWVKSVLITRFAHPVLTKAKPSRSNGSDDSRGGRRGREEDFGSGKVLDMGCGKGGDMTKWAKAKPRELFGVGMVTITTFQLLSLNQYFFTIDIAAVSVEQARQRWSTLRLPRFSATFAPLDCYTQPLTQAFRHDQLGIDPVYVGHDGAHLTGEPFDVVSMQFCMHYAFETKEKAQCMLENVSRYLRKGGVFIGTIPNADFLLYVFLYSIRLLATVPFLSFMSSLFADIPLAESISMLSPLTLLSCHSETLCTKFGSTSVKKSLCLDTGIGFS